MSDIHLYMIAYSPDTADQVSGSGFQMLDNLTNERPDWYEYWPIRRFMLSQPLVEGHWYGFFSPKFSQKTMLDFAATHAFVAEAASQKNADVVLFSPQPDMAANFLSVFEQAEVFDPGFIQSAKAFLATQGMDVPLESVVMDSRQTVFSNYFAAKPPFWREWFALTEALFAICEDRSHPLVAELRHPTTYGEGVQRKVFLLERLASLILLLHPEFKVAVFNPYNFGWSISRFRENPSQTYINDALKIAFRELGFPQYIEAYAEARRKFSQTS